MYGNGSSGPMAGAAAGGTLAYTGAGSFTIAVIAATVCLALGALLMVRSQWLRRREAI